MPYHNARKMFSVWIQRAVNATKIVSNAWTKIKIQRYEKGLNVSIIACATVNTLNVAFRRVLNNVLLCYDFNIMVCAIVRILGRIIGVMLNRQVQWNLSRLVRVIYKFPLYFGLGLHGRVGISLSGNAWGRGVNDFLGNGSGVYKNAKTNHKCQNLP